jgi:hypothetical protein
VARGQQPDRQTPDDDPFAAFGSEPDIPAPPTPGVGDGDGLRSPRPSRRRPGKWLALLAIAAMAILAGVVGFLQWQRRAPAGDAPATLAGSRPAETPPVRTLPGDAPLSPPASVTPEAGVAPARRPEDAGSVARNPVVDPRLSPAASAPSPTEPVESRFELQPLLPAAEEPVPSPDALPAPLVAATPLPVERESSPPAPVPVPVPAAVASAPSAASARVADSNAIAAVLKHYEQAYDNLDANAAAAVWPSVDVSALTRAFARLRHQNLEFTSCSFVVATNAATARCDGSVHYTRSIGDPTPRREDHAWTMELERAGERWQIARIIAR